ncbi:proline rich transmembrane protein 1B-like [Ranitomeya imitator]|uniref:proline rich transmembrane protein 1B-like n=1 Tax=Ranitomeya imitator TaxID=111125 RepID=UPI0037E7782C
MEDGSKLRNPKDQDAAVPLMPYPTQQPSTSYVQGVATPTHQQMYYPNQYVPGPQQPTFYQPAQYGGPMPPMVRAPLQPTPMVGASLQPTPMVGAPLQPTPMVGAPLQPTPIVGAPLQPTYHDYLYWSIVNMIFFCLPLGIAALIFSFKTQNDKARNDLNLAKSHSFTARVLNIIATILGTCCYITVIIVVVVTQQEAYRRATEYTDYYRNHRYGY